MSKTRMAQTQENRKAGTQAELPDTETLVLNRMTCRTDIRVGK